MPPHETPLHGEHAITGPDSLSASRSGQPSEPLAEAVTLELVSRSLEDDKAIEPVIVDLRGKTTMADYMVIATGTSQRHIASMAEKLIERLKALGYTGVQAEGLGESSWVLIDANDVIVHLFRAETRAIYDLERLWSVAPPERSRVAAAVGN